MPYTPNLPINPKKELRVIYVKYKSLYEKAGTTSIQTREYRLTNNIYSTSSVHKPPRQVFENLCFKTIFLKKNIINI